MKNKCTASPSVGTFITILIIACLASCQRADVSLTIGNGSGSPGSENNIVEITIDNPVSKIKGIQADICDEGNYLQGVACEPIGSASEFTCAYNELSDGCFRIMILSLSGDVIPEGEGPIISISYNVSEDAPDGRCVDLTARDAEVSDEERNLVPAVMNKGAFCF